ncbi:MAG TPA: DUF3833 domain-containing protein [Verrucomicrobia bacterium]|nr:DUF3833 domain-containing protein [Verrucomicrobiota bacterium]
MIQRTMLWVVLCALLSGCASLQIEDFANRKPAFVPQVYFNGPMTAYGLIKDRRGKVVSRFKGRLIGRWDEHGVGTLDELFVYENGDTQKRVWTFRPTGTNTFVGTAGDIVGEAPMVVMGNTLMIDYTMRIPRGKGTVDVDVRDWLHLQEDGVILNHSQMKKFGVRVGELVITIIKDFPPLTNMP